MSELYAPRRHFSGRLPNFGINPMSPFARGLFFAGLGHCPGGYQYMDSSVYGRTSRLVGYGAAGHTPNDAYRWQNEIKRVALVTNGTTDYVQFSTQSTVTIPFTVACWFWTPTISSGGYFVSIDNPLSANQNYYIGFNTITGQCAFNARYPNATYQQCVGGRIIAGRWNHICGVAKDIAFRELYVNGQYVTKSISSIALPDPPHTISIGRLNASTPVFSNKIVRIADPMIWLRALSKREIANLAVLGDDLVSGLILNSHALANTFTSTGNRRRRVITSC